jgi:type VI secretion system protein ImpA
MSVIDVEKLLQAISGAEPCGADLEYDAGYLEMTRAAAGKPAQQIGGQVIPGEEPNWKDVRARCIDLIGRSLDLRIATYLTRALLGTDGLAGFSDGLALARGLVERHWADVHPRLDPEDDNDPTIRVNTLGSLADRDLTVNALRVLPLASSRRLGRYSLRDHEIATGVLSKPEGVDTVADKTSIDAAFLDMDVTELESTASAVQAAIAHLAGLDQALSDAVGAGSSADFSPLSNTLKSMNLLLQQQLGRRGLAPGTGADTGYAAGSDSEGGEPAMGGMPAMSGPIQSREDVIRLLDQVSDWYSKYEPSSPVPLLLQRAKRLVNKNFLEAIQDLTPSGVSEIQTIAGTDSSS